MRQVRSVVALALCIILSIFVIRQFENILSIFVIRQFENVEKVEVQNPTVSGAVNFWLHICLQFCLLAYSCRPVARMNTYENSRCLLLAVLPAMFAAL